MANRTNTLSHTKWMCKYHIIFTSNYKRAFNDRLCAYVSIYTIKSKRIEFYGIFKLKI